MIGSGLQTGGDLQRVKDGLHRAGEIGKRAIEFTKERMYHDLHDMSPYEFGAVKEAARQAIGHATSPFWFPMSPGPLQAPIEHYKKLIGMSHPAEAAEELRVSGSGFFDTVKHGFGTVVKHARTLVDHGTKFVGVARSGIDLAKKIPVISKYAEKGDELLKKAESALSVAQKAVSVAEGIDEKISGSVSAQPVQEKIKPQLSISAPTNAGVTSETVPDKPDIQMGTPWTVGSYFGGGFAGAGLRTGGMIAGAGLATGGGLGQYPRSVMRLRA